MYITLNCRKECFSFKNKKEDEDEHMYTELQPDIPHIKESDIQMFDSIAKGRFGNIIKGSIKKENAMVQVAFKTLKCRCKHYL